MAMPNAPRHPPAPPARSAKPAAPEAAEAEPDRPSELDEVTHAEYRMLYAEAGQNIRFSKRQQWRVVEYFTLLSFALVAICGLTTVAKDVTQFIAYFLLFAGVASIIVLGMLQMWQYDEARKLDRLAADFSSNAHRVLRIKGRVGADINRYVILFILLLLIMVSDIVVFRILMDMGR
jgi:hypothetical protein